MIHAWTPSWSPLWISLLTLEDILEIAIFILAFRQISVLLHRQKDPRALLGWYAYSAAMLGAYTLCLHAIMFLAIVLLPAIIVLGIVVHEKRVQQALIPHERIDAAQVVGPTSNWVDELMSFCLQRINLCYDVHIICERQHALNTCLTADTRLDARFSKKTVDLLVTAYDKDDIIWLSITPSIISHAGRWREQQGSFIEHAAYVSATLDCVALRACSTTRRFSIAVQGKIIENLSAHHALNLVHELLGTPRTKQIKGDTHDIYAHQEPTQRPSDAHLS